MPAALYHLDCTDYWLALQGPTRNTSVGLHKVSRELRRSLREIAAAMKRDGFDLSHTGVGKIVKAAERRVTA